MSRFEERLQQQYDILNELTMDGLKDGLKGTAKNVGKLGKAGWNAAQKAPGMLNKTLDSIDRAHAKMKSGDTFGAVGSLYGDAKKAWSAWAGEYGEWEIKVIEQWENMSTPEKARYSQPKTPIDQHIKYIEVWNYNDDNFDSNVNNLYTKFKKKDPATEAKRELSKQIKQAVDSKQQIPENVTEYLSDYELFVARQWNRSIGGYGSGGPSSETWRRQKLQEYEQLSDTAKDTFGNDPDKYIEMEAEKWENRHQ